MAGTRIIELKKTRQEFNDMWVDMIWGVHCDNYGLTERRILKHFVSITEDGTLYLSNGKRAAICAHLCIPLNTYKDAYDRLKKRGLIINKRGVIFIHPHLRLVESPDTLAVRRLDSFEKK